MKPRVSILSPDFKYVPAVSTDVARTFARIRREQRQRSEQESSPDAADVATALTLERGVGEVPTVVRGRRTHDQLRLSRGGRPSSEPESISRFDSVR